MAHTAADGSKWSNASQARKIPQQPVKNLPKPTAEPASSSSDTGSTEQDHSQGAAPQVEVTQDGDMFTVTAKYGSADEAHAAAQALQQPQQDAPGGNPAMAMM